MTAAVPPAAPLPEPRTVAEAVGRAVAALGAGRAFGVVGSGNFHLTNALRAAGVPFTAARHEGGAATMADAWARSVAPGADGRRPFAVVSLHQGCGFTNALTGIGEAAKSRTPVLVLTADTADGATASNFWVDQDAAAEAVGAVAMRVHRPADAVAVVRAAVRRVVEDRRTVVLSVPIDVQAMPAALDPTRPQPEPAPLAAPRRIRPDADSVARLVDLLEAARRPVLIAGRGAVDAGPELRALAEAAGAVLATSAVVKGLFADDEFSLGIPGGFSTPLAAETIAAADLVIGVGCALNDWTTRHGRLIDPLARIAQIDVDEQALGRLRPVALGVVGDAALTAVDAAAELRARLGDDPPARWRTPELAARIREAGRWADLDLADHGGDRSTTGGEDGAEARIDPRRLTAELDRLLPAERVVAVDSGNSMGYPSQYLEVPAVGAFCFTQAFQAIGLGLATAIGAALAQPERLPVLGTGDGGFAMAIAELETAVRLRLPLCIVVYNDAAYGAEVHHFTDASDDELAGVVFPDVDFAAIARGFGASGVAVRTVDDLAAVREWLDSEPEAPLVIDAKIAPDGGAWWLQEAFGH
ncbi:MAG: thiamine pyrophosphate-binding protein [Microbacteriaceae bacterium]|nr:thiamine pyrophosphate-binding protein [Microbacteriaceae bacterium]